MSFLFLWDTRVLAGGSVVRIGYLSTPDRTSHSFF